MQDLPDGVRLKLFVNLPDEDAVEVRVRVSNQYLKEHKGFGFNTLNSLSPISVVILVFKTCIEALGMKVTVDRGDSDVRI